jgi:type IV secretion system protein VirB10
MNQNIPPNQPGSPENGSPQGGGYEQQPANPYLSQQEAAPPPDLDANAPFLKSPRDRKVDAKMLLFVGAALLLLILLLFFMYKRATGGEDTHAKPDDQEKVAVPDLPEVINTPPPLPPPAQEPTPPIGLAQEPQLPPASYSQQPGSEGPPQPTGPSLMERRIIGAGGDGSGGGGGASGKDAAISAALDQQMARQQQALQAAGLGGGTPPQKESLISKAANAQTLRNPDTLLVRGTFIRCVLETRIITDIPGFTSCIVTEPVYSINGRKLLLPKGSKVLGAYDTDANGPRVAVIWDRIITPNGFNVTMKSPGVDGLGSAGHPGKYNAHWPSRIASALMISLVADAFKYAAAEHGPTQNEVSNSGLIVQSPYESVTAKTMERLANQAVVKSMNRPATVTINQGTVLNVYVAQDVDFAYVLPRINR